MPGVFRQNARYDPKFMTLTTEDKCQDLIVFRKENFESGSCSNIINHCGNFALTSETIQEWCSTCTSLHVMS